MANVISNRNTTKNLINAITRLIRIKINKIDIPPNPKLVVEKLGIKYEKLSKTVGSNEEIEKLYHKYMLGADIMAILNSDDYFNRGLYYKIYPKFFTLIEPKPNIIQKQKSPKKQTSSSEDIEWNFAEPMPYYEIIPEHIPIFRKVLIKILRRYIFIMEYKRHIDEKGIDKIAITDEKKYLSNVENDKYFAEKKNKFNKVPLEQVCKYFMQLAEIHPIPFLTEQEVLNFIDKAFCGNNKIGILVLNNTNRNKGLIWRLFYDFFYDCCENTIYDTTKQSKKKYVGLITSNFSNWEYKTVFENFSKSDTKMWKRLKDL